MLWKRFDTPLARYGTYFIPRDKIEPMETKRVEFGKLGIFSLLLREFTRVPADNEDWYDRVLPHLAAHVP